MKAWEHPACLANLKEVGGAKPKTLYPQVLGLTPGIGVLGRQSGRVKTQEVGLECIQIPCVTFSGP